ncbi:penicillin-binding protein 2 [Rubricoccus marinus]|uniref:Penicillin-binding protein 2 n=1 Tax=Rubricoccus marinus TaxID=716817 RepID=A0A259TWN0_9BACT|nr:penicillin-binding protein 2 [Rubricoccus marinus]OZC02165.1 penicillin-binding protein 2 [Rubricoccus marinus]
MSVVAATSHEDARLRARVFTIAVLVLVSFLGARLVQMQLVDRAEYLTEAEGNAIEEKIVRPARGYVFDRNGILLVDNEATLAVTVSARYFDVSKLPLVSELSGVPLAQLKRKYEEIFARSGYQTAVLLDNVPFAALARLRENQYRLPGIGFREDQQRRYHSEARLSHVLGYVKEIDAEGLDDMREQGYRLGDKVGISGIEAEYEPVLRGRVGREYKLVNVHGMEVQAYEGGSEDVQPESGVGLKLTVDARVQALAESLFVDKRGGAVMIDVKTGGIISMVSAPDYDPTALAGRMTQADVDYLYRNPEKPLFNRATQAGMLPPGSTWKPFMSAVALQEGMISEDTELYCGGGYMLGRFFRCHGGSHGNISVRRAIQVSCNTFFFRLMNDTFETPDGPKRMNLEMWGDWANRFGFGTLAPLDLPNQDPGLIPDSSYFNDRWGRGGWGPGFTVNLGIGQGNMGATPLQLARYTAAVANGGTLVTPHLVLEQIDPETGQSRTPQHPRARTIPMEPRNLEVVREGMRLVATAGTARRSQILASRDGRFPEIPIAGKTGTAENPRGKDHAVFIAFAPYDDPQVAVGVIVENAGYGSQTAGPISSLMIEQYFRGEVAPERIGMIRSVQSFKSVGRI